MKLYVINPTFITTFAPFKRKKHYEYNNLRNRIFL